MVKTPRTRHSKSRRRPVTIDLDPASVSRVSGEAETSGVAPGTSASTPPESTETETGTESGPAETAAATTPNTEYPDTAATSSTENEADRSDSPLSEEQDSGSFATGTERVPDDEPDTLRSAAATEHPAQPQENRNGAGMAFFAGIVGAVAALIIAGVLQWAGALPVISGNDGNGQIADLRQQVASLQDNVGNASDGSTDAVAAKKVSDLQGTVDSLQTKLDDIQSGDATSSKNVQSLESRISAVEKKVSSLAQNGDAQEAVDTLDQRLSKVQTALQSATDAANQAQSSNGARLKSLDERVSELTNKVQANNNQPSVMRLVAATTLKSAIDRGAPFGQALDTFSKVTPDAPDLEPLRKFADSGIDTRATLANEVDDVASAMVSAAREDDPNAGYAERLWNSARGLVNVRPVGAVEGNEVPDIVARFEAHVKAGDYDKALAEYDELPGDAKAAGEAFADKLKARQAADGIMNKALSDALKAA